MIWKLKLKEFECINEDSKATMINYLKNRIKNTKESCGEARGKTHAFSRKGEMYV